jgi:hypothetical protein
MNAAAKIAAALFCYQCNIASMKVIVFVIVAVILIATIGQYQKRQRAAERERAQFVQDSIRADFVRDSTRLAVQDSFRRAREQMVRAPSQAHLELQQKREEVLRQLRAANQRRPGERYVPPPKTEKVLQADSVQASKTEKVVQ